MAPKGLKRKRESAKPEGLTGEEGAAGLSLFNGKKIKTKEDTLEARDHSIATEPRHTMNRGKPAVAEYLATIETNWKAPLEVIMSAEYRPREENEDGSKKAGGGHVDPANIADTILEGFAQLSTIASACPDDVISQLNMIVDKRLRNPSLSLLFKSKEYIRDDLDQAIKYFREKFKNAQGYVSKPGEGPVARPVAEQDQEMVHKQIKHARTNIVPATPPKGKKSRRSKKSRF